MKEDESYLLYMVGAGDGCDYTIGCNTRLLKLESKDYLEAQREATAIILENYSSEENRLSHAEVMHVSFSKDLNLNYIYHQKKLTEDLEKQKQTETEEKKLLAQLKAKYEKH